MPTILLRARKQIRGLFGLRSGPVTGPGPTEEPAVRGIAPHPRRGARVRSELARLCELLPRSQGIQRDQGGDRGWARAAAREPRADRHRVPLCVRARPSAERRARRSDRAAASGRLGLSVRRSHAQLSGRERCDGAGAVLRDQRVRAGDRLARNNQGDGARDRHARARPRDGLVGHLLSTRRRRRDRNRDVLARASRLARRVFGPALWLLAMALPRVVFMPSLAAPRSRRERTRSPARASIGVRGLLRGPRILSYGACYFCLKLIRYSLLFWLPYYLHTASGLIRSPAATYPRPSRSAARSAPSGLGSPVGSHHGWRPALSRISISGLAGALLLYALLPEATPLVALRGDGADRRAAVRPRCVAVGRCGAGCRRPERSRGAIRSSTDSSYCSGDPDHAW